MLSRVAKDIRECDSSKMVHLGELCSTYADEHAFSLEVDVSDG